MTSIAAGSVSESAEETTPREHSPGTLGFALQAEADGLGSVRFLACVPYWHASPPRFPISTEATS